MILIKHKISNIYIDNEINNFSSKIIKNLK